MKNIILIIIALLFLAPVGFSGQSFWMDNNGLIDAGTDFTKYLSIWSDEIFGSPSTTTYTSIINYFYTYIAVQIFSYEYAYYIMYFGVIFSILFLGEKIANLFYREKYITIGLSLGFLFNLSLLRFFYGQGTITVFYAVIGFLIMMYSVLRIYFQDNKEKKYFLFIALSSLLVSHPFFFFFYNFLLFIILFFLVKLPFKNLFILFIGIFLLNFYWIFQFIYGGTLLNFDLLPQLYTTNLVNIFSNNSSFYKSFSFLGKDFPYIEEFFGWNSFLILINLIILWGIFFYKIIKNSDNRLKRFYLIIWILLLILFLFSIGAKKPLGVFYEYVYLNFGFFSAFRTFSNVLVFAFILFYIFVIAGLSKRIAILTIFSNIVFVFAFLLSVIQFGYSKSSHIPKDYFAIKDIIDSSSLDGNVLLLPCSAYDLYSWDTGKQDKYFLQAFFQKNGLVFYRPTLDGYRPLQGFLPDYCNKSIPQELLKKYNIQFILQRKDLLFLEKGYYQENDRNWLSELSQIYSSEYADLYETNISNHGFLEKRNSSVYTGVGTFSGEENIILFNNFNNGWKVYIEKYNFSCKDIRNCDKKDNNLIFSLKKLFQKPVFDTTHKIAYDYANSWTIDPNYIKENLPKDYYKENPDGSIDVRLTLYFKPQSYFYLGILISLFILLILFSYLVFGSIQSRKRLPQHS